ncbi:vWA domain-containing protein [Chondromyces crocatus]|nr:VWA domain-containing protein [Chondromyces crocatus]
MVVMGASGGLTACSGMDRLGDVGEPGEMDGNQGSSGTGAGDYGAQAPPTSPYPEEQPEETFTCAGLDEESAAVLYLSSDDSNSMGSPAQVRELLREGIAPSPWTIRTYEFLNYYRIAYNAAPDGQLRIVPQMQEAEEPGLYHLQIGVRSQDPDPVRRPMTLTFVLDTSGSMEGIPMARQKAAVEALSAGLTEGDVVNMVTWNTTNAVVLSGHMVNGPDDPGLQAAVNALSASGGTDLESGLAFGYQLALQHYGPDRLNRVILISDGGANVGVTSAELIANHSEDADREGIYLVGIGAGPASGYNDALMDAVTDKGRGAYVYLDSTQEALEVLRDRFDEVMEVAARGVQVELTLPWYFKIERFYGEEYSEDASEIEPQHLAPGDAMIFNQIVRACDPDVIDLEDPIRVTARWESPLTYERREVAVEASVGQLLAADTKQLIKGRAIIAYAEALKEGDSAALRNAHDQVVAANPNGADPELSEIAQLLQLHPSY